MNASGEATTNWMSRGTHAFRRSSDRKDVRIQPDLSVIYADPGTVSAPGVSIDAYSYLVTATESGLAPILYERSVELLTVRDPRAELVQRVRAESRAVAERLKSDPKATAFYEDWGKAGGEVG
jgi:hypothetical protein